MTIRPVFPVIALFWMTMNVLLWRAEFGGGKEPGSPVSPDVIWERMLNSPDDSTLEIIWNGKKIGYCRWVPNVGEGFVRGKARGGESDLEGMVRRVSGYSIEMEGNVLVGEPATRMRFTTRLLFSTNQVWQGLSLHAARRPMFWDLETVAADETVSVKYEDGDGKWSRVFTYDELRHPRALLEDFGGPAVAALFSLAPGLSGEGPLQKMTAGLRWEARSDTLKIGRSAVRVYRLEARLFDRYQAVVTVSRSGEIMRVELPNGVQLVNDALTNL